MQDEQTLITHQKTKHFKCGECHKKLTTAKALSVHSLQVHKTSITAVPDAHPGREDPAWDIFGMSGVPEGMVRGSDPPPRGGAPQGVAPPPQGAMPPPYGMMPYGMQPPGFPPPQMGMPYGVPPPG
jgi:hypothetical protein